MPLSNFRRGNVTSRVYRDTTGIWDSAKDYELYAQEARSRDEKELAQFFEGLAHLLYEQAEKSSRVASGHSFKSLLLERWRSCKELIEI